MEVLLKTSFRTGRAFRLCDADFEQRLVLKAEPAADLPAKPIDPKLVLAHLKKEGIQTDLIHPEAIIEACLGRQDTEVVIARGWHLCLQWTAGLRLFAACRPGSAAKPKVIGWTS